MRTYLVVVEDGQEARLAVRYAARRAARTGGTVELLSIIAPQEFAPWGGVQATIEEEARLRAEALVKSAAGALAEETGVEPQITLLSGEPVDVVRQRLDAGADACGLVLAAPASGSPGPLIDYLAGSGAGALPCPLIIVPGGLTEEAIDRLS